MHRERSPIMMRELANNPIIHLHRRIIQEKFPNSFGTPDHPPYSLMIVKAIDNLEDKSEGLTKEAILDYIVKVYKDLPYSPMNLLNFHLEKLVERGEIVCYSGDRYMLPSKDSDSMGKNKREKQSLRKSKQNGMEHVEGVESQGEQIIEENQEECPNEHREAEEGRAGMVAEEIEEHRVSNEESSEVEKSRSEENEIGEECDETDEEIHVGQEGIDINPGEVRREIVEVSLEKDKRKQLLKKACLQIDEIGNITKRHFENAMEDGATLSNPDGLKESFEMLIKAHNMHATLLEYYLVMESLKQSDSATQQIKPPNQKREAEIKITRLEDLSLRKNKQIRKSNQPEAPGSRENLAEVHLDSPHDENGNRQMPTVNISEEAAIPLRETDALKQRKENASGNAATGLENNGVEQERPQGNPTERRAIENEVTAGEHPIQRQQQKKGEIGTSNFGAKKFRGREMMHEQLQRQLRPRAPPKPLDHRSVISSVSADGDNATWRRNLEDVPGRPQGEGENVVEVTQTIEEPLNALRKKAPRKLKQRKLCPPDQVPSRSDNGEKLLPLQNENEEEHPKRRGRPPKVKSDVITECKQQKPKGKLKGTPRKEKKSPNVPTVGPSSLDQHYENRQELGGGRGRPPKRKLATTLDTPIAIDAEEQQRHGQREPSPNAIPVGLRKGMISRSSEGVADSNVVLSLPAQHNGRGKARKGDK